MIALSQEEILGELVEVVCCCFVVFEWCRIARLNQKNQVLSVFLSLPGNKNCGKDQIQFLTYVDNNFYHCPFENKGQV